jgi:predicted lipid-binding transport protein (Tim44 family)
MLELLPHLVAAAGGGSSGFGGGGGSSGGGFSGGGSSSGTGATLPWQVWVLIVVGALLFAAFGIIRGIRTAQRRAARKEAVRLAAVEAAQDDPAFAADAVQARALSLFRHVQERWSENDVAALERVVDASLMEEWRRRLEDFRAKGWRNVVDVGDDPEIEYVGMTNRDGTGEDRVVVRITDSLEDYVVDREGGVVRRNGADGTTVAFAEFWTLRREGDHWILASVESDAEGAHQWDAPLVATPWSDRRLADEALVELAVADAAPPAFGTAEIAEIADLDFDGDARGAALDLALADGRFAPDVLEAAVRRAIEAWGRAVDGADDPLEALAAPAAVRALLFGGDGGQATRVVLRGAVVERVRVAALHAAAHPPAMTVDVTVTAVRYVEDRATAAVVAGSREAPTTTTQRWTFALEDDPDTPWRLVEVG